MDEFDDNEIGRLLRLKKYEQPPPGYFENFLHEFHRRQRDELLRQPLWRIALGRAQDFMMQPQCCAPRVLSRGSDGGAALRSRDLAQNLSDPAKSERRHALPLLFQPKARPMVAGVWLRRSPLASPSLNHVRISRLTGRPRLRVMCWTACL